MYEAQKMHTGIRDFSGEEYTNIRKAYNNPAAMQIDKLRMEALDSYIKGAPKWKGQIYRGINVSPQVASSILSKPTVDMLGPSSWSSDLSTAQRFANCGWDSVRMVFVLSENKSGASITHIASYNGAESEVTAPSGVQYVIDSVRKAKVGGMDWIYVFVHE